LNNIESVFSISFSLLKLLLSPPQPAGLRNCNAAAFAFFKKLSAIANFLNPAVGVTKPKDAAYAVTGINSKHSSESLF
jgi:hypothetical protein